MIDRSAKPQNTTCDATKIPNTGGECVAYVVKRYPRYSETFIINEILAHEASGMDIRIFACRPPIDTHFQDILSRVRAPVRYLASGSPRASDLLKLMREVFGHSKNEWTKLASAQNASSEELFQALQLAVSIRDNGISHVHAHFATSAATIASLAAAIADVTYSVTMHAKDIFHESVDSDAVQELIDASKFVVTVSDYNVEYLKTRYQCADKVERIYNGLDLDQFEHSTQARRENYFVAIGRLVEKKGLRYLVEACDLLCRRGVSFQCDIIGSGELEPELAKQIADLKLGDSVRLVGSLPQREVKERLSRAKLLAAPCIVGEDGNRDGLPTVLIEAMALGTPCISTAVTGIPEIVRHEQTGLIVNSADANALAEAINQLIARPQLCSILSSRGRQVVECEFDIHRNSRRIRDRILQDSSQPSSVDPLQAQLQTVQ